MSFSRYVVATTVCLVLVGCWHAGWEKPGATTADFNRDAAECEREADAKESIYGGSRLLGAPNARGLEERCLAARGWIKSRPPNS
jgi:hypothetical protein